MVDKGPSGPSERGAQARLEGPLVAVRLPRVEAAAAIRRAWDAGEAVLPLDPDAPHTAVRRTLEELRPTHLVDVGGRQPLDGGVPVPGDVAAVVTTSGTTGGPRGVELTWSGLRASAGAVATALDMTSNDTWLCCLPLHHVAGLAVVGRAWATGTRLVVTPRFDAAGVGATEATLVSLVPTTLARALDARADLGGFRAVLVGGGPVPDGLRDRAAAAGTRAVATYGLTETWGGVVHDGHPLDGMAVRLGRQDEIELRTPTVMRGYRLRPDDTDSAFTADGWLRTGDAGAIEADGRLRVVDRLDDVVITGGVNVSPSQVEAVLIRHPAVADVAVTGAPDPEWGQRVMAHVVVVDGDEPPTLDALRDFAADELGAPQLPREVVTVGAIPRTPSGKPLRRLLRQR